MKEKLRTIYVCSQCGEETPRWLGRCPSCGEWNTLVEDVVADHKVSPKAGRGGGITARQGGGAQVKALAKVDLDEDESRIVSGIPELDRVLGGGIVLGGVVLIGGEPGAGKSTLLLQLSSAVGRERPVLYVSGEESVRQIKLRSQRLGGREENISVVAESSLEEIELIIEKNTPGMLVVDSIQTLHTQALTSSAGSVSQVKECAARLMQLAKEREIPVFIVGHVNKDGAIAGPKVMEHIVDTVLYFEGDRMLPYRILRAVKNRYGSTNEIGMFDMTQAGLVPIENPSEMLLEGRPVGVSGNCVGCILEGSRPIMSDIQALVTKTSFGTPRRAALGVDAGRTNLLLAVLEKRAGFFMGNLDVYINVVGGLTLNETACDLALCLALVSSLTDTPVPDSLIAIGEVGLGGEIRGIANLELRLREAQRIGFTRAIVPKQNLKALNLGEFSALSVTGVGYLQDAVKRFAP